MSTHQANVSVQWTGGFSGRGTIDAAGFNAQVSLPKEFGGAAIGTSPEDLLLSSIASCHLITLGIILDKNGVDYQSLSIEGRLLTKTGPPPVIEEVQLTIHIATQTGQDELEKLGEKVDGFCLIGKALKSEIKKTVKIIRTLPAALSSREAMPMTLGV